MVTPTENHHSPHVIPSENESISYETSIDIVAEVQPIPPSPTDEKTTEPSNKKPQKNYSEPLSTHTLNLVHHNVSNLPSIPPFSTPAPCENRTQF